MAARRSLTSPFAWRNCCWEAPINVRRGYKCRSSLQQATTNRAHEVAAMR